jgi:hypothetical protein
MTYTRVRLTHLSGARAIESPMHGLTSHETKGLESGSGCL